MCSQQLECGFTHLHYQWGILRLFMSLHHYWGKYNCHIYSRFFFYSLLHHTFALMNISLFVFTLVCILFYAHTHTQQRQFELQILIE